MTTDYNKTDRLLPTTRIIHTANIIFTNIVPMADKHNIPKGKMHNIPKGKMHRNCKLLSEDIVCKITQRNNIWRANTCDPALKLLNEEITHSHHLSAHTSTTDNTTKSQTPYHSRYITPKQYSPEQPVLPWPNSEQMSPTTHIFKQNRRSQTLSPLVKQNNTLIQLHKHKHTTAGHGFVDGSRGGGVTSQLAGPYAG